MPLIEAKIQKDLASAIEAALKKQFAKEGPADPESHKKMAAAIAEGVAKVLVTALTTEAQIMPGIPTAGSPAAQVTTGPGKIS